MYPIRNSARPGRKTQPGVVAEIPDAAGRAARALKGDLKGFWSVTVRANWRIIFRFEGTDAFDVELIDYH